MEKFTVLAAVVIGAAMALLVIVGSFRIAGPGPTTSFSDRSSVTAVVTAVPTAVASH
jgi:hypothetical protein